MPDLFVQQIAINRAYSILNVVFAKVDNRFTFIFRRCGRRLAFEIILRFLVSKTFSSVSFFLKLVTPDGLNLLEHVKAITTI